MDYSITAAAATQSNDWTCPICLDGLNQEPTLIHPCGRHVYHLMCYVMDSRTGNKKCGMCRGGDPVTSHAVAIQQRRPPLIRSGNVLPKLLTSISNKISKCVYCLKDIPAWKTYVELLFCCHVMHSECAIKALLQEGITQTGQILCKGCQQNNNNRQ